MIADLIAAWRQVRRAPAHAGIVVFSLGVGMAACVAAFSVMNVLAFEARPGIRDRSDLVHLRWSSGGSLFSEEELDALERETGTAFSAFTLIAAEARRPVAVVLPTEPVTVTASFVSPDFFAALGTLPLRGRLLNATDAEPDAAPAVVISDRLWRQSFSGSDDVAGRTIAIGGRPFTIAGVAPDGFSGVVPRDVGQGEDTIPQLWVPLRFRPNARDRTVRALPSLSIVGRLRPEAAFTRALAELAVIGSRLPQAAQRRQERGGLWGYRSGLEWTDSPLDVLLVLGVFLLVPLAVLFIGCANVVNLQLARATERSREIGVRLALGASRWRLARLLGLEVVFLAALAGLAGWRGAVVLLRMAAPYVQLPVTVDAEAAVFIFALAILVIGLSGFTPAWFATRDAVAAGLKETQEGGIRLKRLRALLVVAQVAVSVMFLFVAALGVRALSTFIISLPPGASQTLVARFDLAESHPGLRDSRPFVDAVLARVRGAQTVTAAGFADFVRGERFIRYWRPADGPDVRRSASGGLVTSGWFDAFGARVVAGRALSDADAGVAVVNQGMALQLAADWPSALGQRLRVSSSRGAGVESVEIVGVVDDYQTLPSGKSLPAIYVPMPERTPAAIVLLARGPELTAAAADLKAAVSAADPVVPWVSLRTLETASGDPLRAAREGMWIAGGLGLSALAIAAIGLHAVLSYMIRRRSHEIGVRMALGAAPAAMAGLVVRQSLGLVAIGAALGLGAAIALGRVLRATFLGISPLDLTVMLAPVALLALAGLLAAAVPAYRAASVDPLVVLREP